MVYNVIAGSFVLCHPRHASTPYVSTYPRILDSRCILSNISTMPAPQTGIHGPLLLEEPLIRVSGIPHPNSRHHTSSCAARTAAPSAPLRRTMRASKWVSPLCPSPLTQKQLADLLKNLSHTDKDAETATAKVDQVTDRMRGLKRKLDTLQPSPAGPSTLRDRLAHVDAALTPSRNAAAEKTAAAMAELSAAANAADAEGTPAADAKADLDRMALAAVVERTERRKTATDIVVDTPARDHTLDRYVVDYLLRTGRMRTAQTLAESQGIEVGVVGCTNPVPRRRQAVCRADEDRVRARGETLVHGSPCLVWREPRDAEEAGRGWVW